MFARPAPRAGVITVPVALLIAAGVLLATLLVPDERASASVESAGNGSAAGRAYSSATTRRYRIRVARRVERCRARAQRLKRRHARRAQALRGPVRRAYRKRMARRRAVQRRRCARAARKRRVGQTSPRTRGPAPRSGERTTNPCAGAACGAYPVQPIIDDRLENAGNLRIGLVANTQVWESNAGGQQDLALEAGARWLREGFDWDVIEPQNDAWNWTRYDAVMRQAAERGMYVLPVLYNSPAWAAPSWNRFPNDFAEYAEYVAKVAERYGPGGVFWRDRPELAAFAPTHVELWNEPYIEYFSIDKVSPSRYARLVKAAVAAGRAANPGVKYLLSADTFYTEAPGDYRNWIDGMYAAVPDLNSYFDAVAIHPYSANLSPDVYTPERGGTRWQFRRVEEMRERFDAHGAANKGFWITELGWATCTQHEDCVSEQDQADYIARVFEYARGPYAGFMEAVFVYHMNDWGPADQTNKEYWFGLRRKDGTRKPAWDSLRRASGLL